MNSISKASPEYIRIKSGPTAALDPFIDQDPVRRRTVVVWRDPMRQDPNEFKGATFGGGPNTVPADGEVFAVAAEDAHELRSEPFWEEPRSV